MSGHLRWLPAVLYMAAIFIASSITIGTLPGGVSDKSWHSLAYALLGVLMLYPLAEGSLAGVTWRRAILAVVLAAAYGVSDEIHQSFVPGRSPEVLDVVADAAGATGGVALCALAAAARAWGILKSSSHPSEP